MSRPTENERRARLAALLLALVATGLCWWLTARNGPILTTDSMSYLSAAESLREGEGFVDHDGEPYVDWPPLEPIALAAPGFLGIDVIPAAAWRNGMLVGLHLWLLFLLLRARGLTPAWTFAGLCIALVVGPGLRFGLLLLSEIAFTVLELLFFWALMRARSAPASRAWWIAALAAGASVLSRYLGLAFVGAGAWVLLVAPDESALRERLLRAARFLLVALALPALWITRNLAIAGSPMGSRPPPEVGFGEQITGTLAVFAGWVVPGSFGAGLSVAIALAVLASFAWAMISRRSARELAADPLVAPMLAYLALLLYAMATVDLDPADGRFIGPLFFPLLVLALESMQSLSRSFLPRRILAPLLLAVATLLGLHGIEVAREVRTWLAGEASFQIATWKPSPLVEAVRGLDQDSTALYTNGPDWIYAYLGMRLALVPDLDEILAGGGATLVLFAHKPLPPHLEWLARGLVRIEILSTHADGLIVRVIPAP